MWDMAGEDYSKGNPVGWRLPAATKERFTDFCEESRRGIEDSCAGALVVWEYLSPAIREQAAKVGAGKGSRKALEETIQLERLSGPPKLQAADIEALAPQILAILREDQKKHPRRKRSTG